jgi:hypothetical protein
MHGAKLNRAMAGLQQQHQILWALFVCFQNMAGRAAAAKCDQNKEQVLIFLGLGSSALGTAAPRPVLDNP